MTDLDYVNDILDLSVGLLSEDHSGFKARLETFGDIVTDLNDFNDCLDLSVGLLSVTTDIIWKITVSFEAGLVACKAIRYVNLQVARRLSSVAATFPPSIGHV